MHCGNLRLYSITSSALGSRVRYEAETLVVLSLMTGSNMMAIQ
jgi:hypothetical protein